MDMDALSALMGEDLAAETFADMWVVFPNVGAAPLLGEARRLADSLGCYVHAVVSDEALSEHAIAFGADRVHVAADAASFMISAKPEFAFFPVAQAAEAGQVAHQLRAGLITDARQLSIDDGTRALNGSHPALGGDYFVDFAITSQAKIVTLDARFLPEPFADHGRSGETTQHEAEASGLVRDLGPVDYTPFAWRPIVKARRIVALGRGLKDDTGAELAKQVAAKIGAEVGGDRSARDSGWIDELNEVGLTNVDAAPDVYLALGVRGDTVHNAAMAQSKLIISVHINPNVSLHKIADAAVVADPQAFAQALLGKL